MRYYLCTLQNMSASSNAATWMTAFIAGGVMLSIAAHRPSWKCSVYLLGLALCSYCLTILLILILDDWLLFIYLTPPFGVKVASSSVS